MDRQFPHELEQFVHGLPVVEFAFVIHALSRHLNANKHVQHALRQVAYQLVINEYSLRQTSETVPLSLEMLSMINSI